MNPSRNPRRVGVEERLGSLETAVAALAHSVEEFIRGTEADIGAIRRELSSAGRNWGTYAAWAVVVLAIVGMVGGAVGWGFERSMWRMEAEQTEQQRQRVVQAGEAGYARAQAEALRREVDRLSSGPPRLDRQQAQP